MKILQMLLVFFLTLGSAFGAYHSFTQDELEQSDSEESSNNQREILFLKQQVTRLKKEIERLQKALTLQNMHATGNTEVIAARSTDLSRQLEINARLQAEIRQLQADCFRLYQENMQLKEIKKSLEEQLVQNYY